MPVAQPISSRKQLLPDELFGHPWILSLLLILSIALRIILLVQNRPLFIDEAALAVEVIETNWLGYFAPLNYQFSPPFFSILQKINIQLFGALEWVLRLNPMLFGIGSLFIFKKWLTEVLPAKVIWFPLAMMAMGWEFVRYGVEAKQYSTDVFCSLLLIYVTIKYPWQNNWKSSLFWAITGALIIWMSMPMVFVLAGIGLYFFIPLFQNKSTKQLYSLLGVGAIWLLSFGIYYQLILGQDIGKSSLQDFHSKFFFPLLPSSLAELKFAGNLLLSFLRTLLGGTLVPLLVGALLLLIGLIHHWRVDRRKCLLLLVPIILAIIASGLGKYSLIPRLTLFFIPFLLFWMGQGIVHLYLLKNRYLSWLLLPLLLLCIFTQPSWEHFTKVFQLEDMPTLMSFVKQRKEADDVIYVYHEGAPAFNFYQNHSAKQAHYELSDFTIGKYDDRATDIAVQNPDTKLWLLCSHIPDTQLENWKTAISKHRKIISMEKNKSGAALLFSPMQ